MLGFSNKISSSSPTTVLPAVVVPITDFTYSHNAVTDEYTYFLPNSAINRTVIYNIQIGSELNYFDVHQTNFKIIATGIEIISSIPIPTTYFVRLTGN